MEVAQRQLEFAESLFFSFSVPHLPCPPLLYLLFPNVLLNLWVISWAHSPVARHKRVVGVYVIFLFDLDVVAVVNIC